MHIKTLVARLVFPVSLAGVFFGSLWAIDQGLPPEQLPLPVTLVSLTLVLLLEGWLCRVGRTAEKHELRTDLSWFGLSAVLDTLSTPAFATAAAWIAGRIVPGLAKDLPFALAFPVALLISELGGYASHRLSHELPWWWRLHAVHHAPHRMVALNNPRLHPVDLLLKQGFSLLPILLLGFSPAVLGLLGALRGLNVAFQHADVDLRHGPLNGVFSTNSVHRWHHSNKPEEANQNYGSLLVIWDQLLGTYRVPDEADNPEKMGLFETPGYPVQEVLRPLAAPWCWRACTKTSHR